VPNKRLYISSCAHIYFKVNMSLLQTTDTPQMTNSAPWGPAPHFGNICITLNELPQPGIVFWNIPQPLPSIYIQFKKHKYYFYFYYFGINYFNTRVTALLFWDMRLSRRLRCQCWFSACSAMWTYRSVQVHAALHCIILTSLKILLCFPGCLLLDT
jgi:hypothetical protein